MKVKDIKHDFSGYATKANLKCTDGRIISKDAFKENDGGKVPLVWQHVYNSPDNVLGYAILENREDGVYAYGVFNNSAAAKQAKELLAHGDIDHMSIFANELKQKGASVLHGVIREVSLVLSGANPGALIENLTFAHSDGSTTDVEDEAIIYTESELEHSSDASVIDDEDPDGDDGDEDTKEPDAPIKHAATTKDKTVQDVFDSLNEEQKNVVYAMIAHALTQGETGTQMAQSNITLKGDNKTMKKNVFDKEDLTNIDKKTLTHAQIKEIMDDAAKCGSLKDSFLQHAVTYGIENIDYLFPDAKTISDSPDFVKRRTEWVNGVINGAKHSPFSRIKSMSADITLDDARAKGYVKGSLKKEEFFALAKRVTTPTTLYKKQKLDRDDIIDITDLDIVAWVKAEMRVMLDEELARAILISDGREADDADKINEGNIRPISKDDAFYAHPVQVPANTAGATLAEEILRARTYYKGSGSPTFYTTEAILTDLLLVKDKIGRRMYPTEAELASALRVSSIVTVEVMEGVSEDNGNLIGILVNMKDYTIGADRGGQVSMFDDFDIDYNQYKYLLESRCSGCLTKPKSALVFWRATGTLATPTAPTFNSETNTITIPTSTGVVYTIDDEVAAAGTYVITEDAFVEASPSTGYYFAPNVTTSWNFTYTA